MAAQIRSPPALNCMNSSKMDVAASEGDEIPNCKPSGWTPLVYPTSAILAGDEMNPYFPLQQDVLTAAVRELLILDKTVDSKTLCVSNIAAKFHDRQATRGESAPVIGPSYLVHSNSSRWELMPKEPKPKSKGRKRHKNAASSTSNKKTKSEGNPKRAQEVTNSGNTNAETAAEPASESSDTALDEFCQRYPDEIIKDAESLAQVIVKRSCVLSNSSPLLDENNKPTRKVSDVDMDNSYGSKDISRFFSLEKMSLLHRGTLPSLLEVSIVSESTIRDLAFDITRNLTQSFDDKTLRMFLGYKSSALKRDRLVHVLSEYLFDVCHAMFAWKQTERELQTTGSLDFNVQKRILHMLFDDRALRKIGGFEASSLLPQALSIARLDISWQESAKTPSGQALLQHHHQDGEALLVGQRRRGHRVRTRVPSVSSDSSDGGTSRSRSSSIASFEDVVAMEEDFIMPDILHVAMHKVPGQSWGVLLSKEGDMCVVVRAPHDGSLKCGDVILSVSNERQEGAEQGTQTPDWFRLVVNLFKTSVKLDLTIRRVGTARTVLPDNHNCTDTRMNVAAADAQPSK